MSSYTKLCTVVHCSLSVIVQVSASQGCQLRGPSTVIIFSLRTDLKQLKHYPPLVLKTGTLHPLDALRYLSTRTVYVHREI